MLPSAAEVRLTALKKQKTAATLLNALPRSNHQFLGLRGRRFTARIEQMTINPNANRAKTKNVESSSTDVFAQRMLTVVI